MAPLDAPAGRARSASCSISDVPRLYRVFALRHLGLGPGRAEELLGSGTPEQLLDTVSQQLTHVDQQLTVIRSRAMARYTETISTRRSMPMSSSALRVYRRAAWAWAVAAINRSMTRERGWRPAVTTAAASCP